MTLGMLAVSRVFSHLIRKPIGTIDGKNYPVIGMRVCVVVCNCVV